MLKGASVNYGHLERFCSANGCKSRMICEGKIPIKFNFACIQNFTQNCNIIIAVLLIETFYIKSELHVPFPN